jgi:hypothetical protein
MIHRILHYTLPAAAELLPPAMMKSPRAWAMLLAIGLQESKFLHRRQVVDAKKHTFGPARGFWQFERGGGTAGVLQHTKTSDLALPAARQRPAGVLLRAAAVVDRARRAAVEV